MAASTAIPIVIAAIVIVIISNGIFNQPIKPRIVTAERMLGIIASRAKPILRNKIINIKRIATKTTPSVMICDW